MSRLSVVTLLAALLVGASPVAQAASDLVGVAGAVNPQTDGTPPGGQTRSPG